MRIPIAYTAILLAGIAAGGAGAQGAFKVLDFWGVGGHAHGSRVFANNFLDSLSKAGVFQVDKSDQASAFTPANLAQYRVILLNNCTELGKSLNPDQRAALLDFMKRKGVVGWHGSADTKGSWPEYTAYVGGQLSGHGIGMAKVNVDTGAAKGHAVVAGSLAPPSINEEWYAYNVNPRATAGVRVLYTIDESTCDACTKMSGGDHPVAWTRQDPLGGRFFYTALGHMDVLFTTNAFNKELLRKAILWAGGGGSTVVRQTGISAPGPVEAGSRGGVLCVDVERAGRYRVELRTLDGRVAARRDGHGTRTLTFEGLALGAVYAIFISGTDGRLLRLVTVQ